MKILFLSRWFPYPTSNGSKIRIYNLLRWLSQNHEISLISFCREGELIDKQGLNGICQSVDVVPFREFDPRRIKALIGFFSSVPRSFIDTYSHEMSEKVRHAVQKAKPDLIIASELELAVYVNNEFSVPRILDDFEIGLVQQNWSNSSEPTLKLRRMINWNKAKRFAKKIMVSFDACTVVSRNEQQLLHEILPDYKNVYIIPNGVDLENYHPAYEQSQPDTLIFSGALAFNANYDAMEFFLWEIFPIIRERVPGALLKITGSTEGVSLSKLSLNDHVIFTGFLPDIRPALASARVCVVPLRYGGGTRLKILEAMAMGIPVVATSKGAEGLNVKPDQDILIADTPGEFAQQVGRVLCNVEIHESLSQNGRRLVENQYGWKAIGNEFEQIVIHIVNSKNI